MLFLTAIIDALVAFVRRNPLFCLLLVVLAVGAPALLRGIAVFILYFILAILMLGLLAAFMLRWRLTRMQRRMEEQFRQGGTFRGTYGEPRQPAQEGEVKVHRTAEAPEKRVAHGVGDYVDFEETKGRGEDV